MIREKLSTAVWPDKMRHMVHVRANPHWFAMILSCLNLNQTPIKSSPKIWQGYVVDPRLGGQSAFRPWSWEFDGKCSAHYTLSVALPCGLWTAINFGSAETTASLALTVFGWKRQRVDGVQAVCSTDNYSRPADFWLVGTDKAGDVNGRDSPGHVAVAVNSWRNARVGLFAPAIEVSSRVSWSLNSMLYQKNC